MNRLASGWLSLQFRVRRSYGKAGAAGALLMLLAALAPVTLESHWHQEAATLAQDTVRLLHEAADRAQRGKPAPRVAEQIRDFRRWFPGIGRNADDLRELVLQAASAGVALDKGEYRMNRNQSSGLLDYEVVLPLKASYPQIRGFIAGVLNKLPHASLAELRMERPAADTTELDARVHFTLVYREE